MARTRRRSPHRLTSDLFDYPQTYDLFQALRLIEHLAAEEHATAKLPPPEPVGRGMDPNAAAMRIRSAVSLGYAAAEATAIRRDKNSTRIEVTQTVVGLTGASGVLPHAFSELVHISVRDRNPGLREFFDLFNNRIAGLLYEAWAKHRLVVEHDRAAKLATPRPIDAALKAIAGVGLPSLTNRLATADDTLVRFGAHFARTSHSAQAVEQVLSNATGHPIRVEQFQGQWLAIAATDRTVLPSKGKPRGRFCQLGDNMVVGNRVYDIQSTVRLVIGPLTYPAFRALLPDGANARGFVDLAAVSLGPDIACRIALQLKATDVPPLKLARTDDPISGSRLGWNTWLASDRQRAQPAQVDIEPASHLY